MVFSLTDADVVIGHKHFSCHVSEEVQYVVTEKWICINILTKCWHICLYRAEKDRVGLTTWRQNTDMAHALVCSSLHHLTVNSTEYFFHFLSLCKPIISLHTVFIKFPFLSQHSLKLSWVLIEWTSIFQFNKETKWEFFNYSLCLGFRASLYNWVSG